MKKLILLLTLLFGFNQIVTAQDNFWSPISSWIKPISGFVVSYGFNALTLGCIGYLGYKVKNLNTAVDKQNSKIQEQNKEIQKFKTEQNLKNQTIKNLMRQQQSQISTFSFVTLDMLEKNERSQRNAERLAIEIIENFKIHTNNTDTMILDSQKVRELKEKAYKNQIDSVKQSLQKARQQDKDVRARLAERRGNKK